MLDEQDLAELVWLVGKAGSEELLTSKVTEERPTTRSIFLHRLEVKLLDMKAAL